MSSDILKSKQDYTIRKINSIMRSYPSKKYEVRFRNGKRKTAASVLKDTKTHFLTFIFSNYWIQKLLTYELNNLIKHECAHAIADDTHGSKFKEMCNKLKCSKKWQSRITHNVDVHPHKI